MEFRKKTLTEYEKEISAEEIREEKEFHRRRVRNFKRMLMVTFIAVCAIPVSMCTYLMIKMNRLDARLEKLVDRVEEGKTFVDSENTSPNDVAGTLVSEQMAYGDLEKGTESEGIRVTLTDSKENSDGTHTEDIEDVEGDSQDITEQTYYNGKKVYLTFDDGPSTYTGELLDVLDTYNVKATFFVVYNDKEEVQPYYQEIVDRGHTIAMHSYSHVYDQVYASKDSFVEDVEKIHDFIYDETGVDCRFYRFPGGSSNQVSKVDIQSLMAYLDEENITYFDWNSLSGDAVDSSLTPSELNTNILGYVRANAGDSVVLMHDLQNNHATIEALPELIQTLKEEGYEICPIEDDTIPVQHVQYTGEENP